jgi:rod shape-determining protein MreD
MKTLINLLIYFSVALIYWWVSTNFSIFGITPNIVLISVICLAILCEPVKAHTFGFFWGLYIDISSTPLFGAFALIYTLLVYLIWTMKKRFDVMSTFFQGLLTFAVSIITIIFYQVLSLIFARNNPFQLKIFLVEPVFNAVMMPFVFYVFYSLKKKFNIL